MGKWVRGCMPLGGWALVLDVGQVYALVPLCVCARARTRGLVSVMVERGGWSACVRVDERVCACVCVCAFVCVSE